jgi:hypothetical protein
MKIARIRSVLLSASLLALAFWFGAHWIASAGAALNGLRSVGPYTHEEEAAFIRSRITLPIVPPEWVSGVDSDELTWIKCEMLARLGLTIAASMAVGYVVRRMLGRQNEKPA